MGIILKEALEWKQELVQQVLEMKGLIQEFVSWGASISCHLGADPSMILDKTEKGKVVAYDNPTKGYPRSS